MTHLEIVKKLIGEVRPIGKTEVDAERYKNLQSLCKLTKDLIEEIVTVKNIGNGSYEHSCQKAGKLAYEELKFIEEELMH